MNAHHFVTLLFLGGCASEPMLNIPPSCDYETRVFTEEEAAGFPADLSSMSGTWEVWAPVELGEVRVGTYTMGTAIWGEPAWTQRVITTSDTSNCPIGPAGPIRRRLATPMEFEGMVWEGGVVFAEEDGGGSWSAGWSNDAYVLGSLPALEAAILADPAHAPRGDNLTIRKMDFSMGGVLEAGVGWFGVSASMEGDDGASSVAYSEGLVERH